MSQTQWCEWLSGVMRRENGAAEFPLSPRPCRMVRAHSINQYVIITLLTMGALSIGGSADRAKNAATTQQEEDFSNLVSLAVRAQPVADVLANISAISHQRLMAAPDTAWTKVTIFSKQRSLREVIYALSELLDYRWETHDSTDAPRKQPSKYVLVQDLESQRYEDWLWRDTLQRSAKP